MIKNWQSNSVCKKIGNCIYWPYCPAWEWMETDPPPCWWADLLLSFSIKPPGESERAALVYNSEQLKHNLSVLWTATTNTFVMENTRKNFKKRSWLIGAVSKLIYQLISFFINPFIDEWGSFGVTIFFLVIWCFYMQKEVKETCDVLLELLFYFSKFLKWKLCWKYTQKQQQWV